MSNQNPMSSQGSQNPWGGFLSGMGAGLGDLYMGNQIGNMPYTNPAQGAQGYLGQIAPWMQGQYNPYIQQGQSAYGQLAPQYQQMLGQGGNLQSIYGQLANNPGQSLNAIGQNFHQSPGYQFNVQQATQAANNAAAAGGMAGSPQEQQYLASTVSGLANQNYNNYLTQATGLMGAGLQGMQGMYNQGLQGEQGVYGQGYNANNELAQSVGNSLLSQGSLAYAGQADQNQFQQMQQMAQAGADSSGFGSMLGGLGSLFGGGGGGGNMFGNLFGGGGSGDGGDSSGGDMSGILGAGLDLAFL